MRRLRRPPRTLVAALVAALVALTLAACGDDDEPAVTQRTIAFLRAVPGTGLTEPVMLAELRAAGFVQGRNLTVLNADASDVHPEPEDAADAVAGWVAAGADLIVAFSSTGADIVRKTAPGVPVLFLSNDPMATGLVADERRPEGNLTGATYRTPADRTLDLARRAIPDLTRIGLAQPAGDPAAEANARVVADAAQELGVELLVEEFAQPEEVAGAVERLAAAGADALLLSTSPAAVRSLAQAADAARLHQLPLIANTNLAESALVVLYPDSEELAHQLGRQAARLLAGADPSSVPVEDPRRFDVRVNLRAAAELGLELPPDLIREATEVVR